MKAYIVFILFVISWNRLESMNQNKVDCKESADCCSTQSDPCTKYCHIQNKDCKKKVGLGGKCLYDDACATANASCQKFEGSKDPICTCNMYHYANNISNQCIMANCNMITSGCVDCNVSSTQDFLKQCKNNSCLNNGRCFENSLKGIQLCQCPSNYYGPKCGIKICNATNCSNVGQCIWNCSEEYQCICPRGYYGVHCEMKICNATNCSNVGQCIWNRSDEFQCICPRGYYGDHCEMKICNATNCSNVGQCIWNCSEEYQCICPRGYYGVHCEMNICNATNCSNVGQCIKNCSEEYQCIFPRGYYGDHCEMKKCADSNCSDNGKCFVNRSLEHQFCVCSPNYHGRRCEAQICNTTCSNGGRCYKNDSTVSTEDKHNCSDNPNAAEVVSRQGDSEKQYTLGHVAIAAIVAFVLGILLVVAVLGICRLRSQGRLCFREKPQRYEGKWEGASNTVTTKVIEKHSLKRQYENKTYENNDIGDKVPFPDSTKDTYDSLSAVESNKPEHVYTGFKTDVPKASDNVSASPNPSMVQSDSGHVYTNLEKRSSHIYETTRDSNVSEHDYFSLSNENFRTSNNNLGTGQLSGNHLPTSKNENATSGTDDPVDTGPYSVLEKREETNGVKTETETQENNESPQSKENDDAYFILQKDGENISQEGDVISNPYFTLEKEQ